MRTPPEDIAFCMSGCEVGGGREGVRVGGACDEWGGRKEGDRVSVGGLSPAEVEVGVRLCECCNNLGKKKHDTIYTCIYIYTCLIQIPLCGCVCEYCKQ